MQIGSKVRTAVDRVTAAAEDTKRAITVIGVLAVVALAAALVALVMASRRRA